MKRLELIHDEERGVEIKYFEDESERYRSWKLPKFIIDKLIPWWDNTKFKIKEFPVVKKGIFYEFKIEVGKYMDIKEFKRGNYCIGAWSIPVFIIEALSDMERDGITSKNI